MTLDVESQVDGDDEHSTHDDANDDNHDRDHAANTLSCKIDSHSGYFHLLKTQFSNSSKRSEASESKASILRSTSRFGSLISRRRL